MGSGLMSDSQYNKSKVRLLQMMQDILDRKHPPTVELDTDSEPDSEDDDDTQESKSIVTTIEQWKSYRISRHTRRRNIAQN